MGQLSDDMIRLRRQINTDRRNRRALVGDLTRQHSQLKDGVADLLEHFRTQRAQTNIHQELTESRREIITHVIRIKEETEQMMEAVRKDLTAAYQTGITKRRQFVSEVRQQVHKNLSDLRKARHKRAQNLQASLRQSRSELLEQLSQLPETLPRIRAQVLEIKQQVGHFLRSTREEMTQTANAGSADRKAYVRNIRRDVSQTLTSFNEFRNSVLTDLEELHNAWCDPLTKPSPQDRPQDTETFPDHETIGPDALDPLSAKEEDMPLEEPAQPQFDETGDDLTLISGIGAERHKQLNDMAIFGFGQLAGQDAVQLQTRLGPPLGKAEIQSWIDQARELTPISKLR